MIVGKCLLSFMGMQQAFKVKKVSFMQIDFFDVGIATSLARVVLLGKYLIIYV